MTSPFQYKDLAELMGSWPISVLQDPSPAQQIQPNSLFSQATLIGSRRETTDGYEVGGLSMTDKGLVNFKLTIFFKPSLLQLQLE